MTVDSQTCGSCGKPLSRPGTGEAATMVMEPTVQPSATPLPNTSATFALGNRTRLPSAASQGGRFAPGTMLAGRYQIIGLLGKGGMGEVYSANDLTLDQRVALKFLPPAMASNPAMLARFHGEVRVARQVSHPNVCRVYDIGEIEGQLFLSMEYVDGEDLGVLLKRIGRLPSDKGVEIARKLCAGLAAAHERGIVHRDLKPANIMIDSEGQVIIMDFGLAGVAEQMVGNEIKAGTPAYMAPEQLAGREVTLKSDLYALGLVLYEIFTGKRPFSGDTIGDLMRVQETTSPRSMTEVVKELDPAVERVILRCLDPDPRKRPVSALAVSAALPGGDPLAAALAAGETPSPDLVAASGSTEATKPWIAFSLAGAVAVILAVIVILQPLSGFIGQAPLDLPPDALMQKAREYAASAGYRDKPVSWWRGFTFDYDAHHFILKNLPRNERWSRIQAGQPNLFNFVYRQSQRYLEPKMAHVDPTDPPPTETGMLLTVLDPQGRLTSFSAVPNQVEAADGATGDEAVAADWKPLLEAAGIDPARAKVINSKWTPPVYADSRVAWEATRAEAPETKLRVEGASLNGKPVYFEVVAPWTRAVRMEKFKPDVSFVIQQVAFALVAGALLLAAILLAVHNLKRGRGDTRAATRLSIFMFAAYVMIWALNGWHLPTRWELTMLFRSTSYALAFAGAVWLGYIAVEPLVRRHWPQAMVSWTRLLAGGLRDPLVGRDLLIGLAAGCYFGLIHTASEFVEKPYGALPSSVPLLETLLGARHVMGTALIPMTESLVNMLGSFLLLFVIRLLLRRDWLAGLAFVGLMTLMGFLGSETPLIDAGFALAGSLVSYLVMTRVGLLATAVAFYMQFLLIMMPIAHDFALWYAGATVFCLILTGSLTAYATRVALAGTSIIKDEYL